MSLTIRYSFREFQDNYEKDFINYQQSYVDASYSDFNYDLISLYKIAIYNVEIIHNVELNILDSKAHFFWVDLNDEIYDEIYDEKIGCVNYEIARKFEISFSKILTFLNGNNDNKNFNQDDSNKLRNTSCPLQIAILNELGFFNLPKIKEMTSIQKEYIISRLLNKGERDVRGNINALNSDSNENSFKYTSSTNATIERAKQIIREKQQ